MNGVHALRQEDLAKALGTDLRNGLGDAEAAERLAKHGPNELPAEKSQPLLFLFLKQFNSGLVYILIGAATLSFLSGHATDGGAILLVILVNATVDFVQERRAETAIAKLRQMVVQEASVIREGRIKRVPASELVPGDVIQLTEGDRIVADARLIHCRDLQTNESALTGESAAVVKSSVALPEATAMPDRSDMVWMGTSVTSGQGSAVVAETGARTAFGGIAASLRSIRRQRTPFEISVDRLGRNLGALTIGLSAVVFLLGYFRGFPPVETFFFAVAMAVSVIPEGLPAVLVVVLAIGVQRMAKRNAVVRHLPSVETLGATDIICTDKTGTLTENKMTVRQVASLDLALSVTGEGWETSGEFLQGDRRIRPTSLPVIDHLLVAAALCNRAAIERREGRVSIVGEPTEAALLVLAAKAGLDKRMVEEEYTVIDEIPFSSARKYRAVLVERRDVKGRSSREFFVAGAHEALGAMSSKIMSESRTLDLDERKREKMNDVNAGMAKQAMRVLAIGHKHIPVEQDKIGPSDMHDVTLLGLVGMIDPPRQGVTKAIERCRQAGIRVIMLTGDHKETAMAIGREIGLINGRPDEGVYTDTEVASLGDDEFTERLRGAAIFARVRPETKLRIVGALQRLGHVVAMTGDGVNDAPALKKAEIGIAMGITGTDVTREVADMVLTDDDFISIVNAVEEGRIVFRNFKQTTAYLFITNMGEAATIMASMLIGLPLPLLPAQILWLNLVTDGFCDVALATERTREDVLSEPPRQRNAPVITRNTLVLALMASALMAAGTLALFTASLADGSIDRARSIAFVTLAVFQLWNVFNMRSVCISIFRVGFLTNKYVVMAVATSFALQLAVLYLPPLQRLFKTTPISLVDWLVILAVSSSVLFAVEAYKVLCRRGIVPRSWL